MIYVENDVINLTRGDDAVLTVPLKDSDGNDYVMQDHEYLIFGVKEFPKEDSEVLLEINSDLGSNLIVISHADTENMEVGFYSAEVQLMLEGGDRVTVWPKLVGNSRISKSNRKNFCLMTEVIQT